jgi:hypothetical protein
VKHVPWRSQRVAVIKRRWTGSMRTRRNSGMQKQTQAVARIQIEMISLTRSAEKSLFREGSPAFS